MTKRLLATTTLLAFATVFTFTFFPVDYADAAHCAQKKKDFEKASAALTKAYNAMMKAYAVMIAHIGRPTYPLKVAKYLAKVAIYEVKKHKCKQARAAYKRCLEEHNGSGS